VISQVCVASGVNADYVREFALKIDLRVNERERFFISNHLNSRQFVSDEFLLTSRER